MHDSDHQHSSGDPEKRGVSTQKQKNGAGGRPRRKTVMTPASPTSSDESIDFTTRYRPVYVTASELAQVEADPVLTYADLTRRAER